MSLLKLISGVFKVAATEQESQTLGGDLSGTTDTATVTKANGATIPAGGALTTGNALKVSGAGTLTYGAINLAGGANHVTGTLPTGNQAAQSMGGDISGTTASSSVVSLTGSAGVVTTAASLALGTNPASAGIVRVPNGQNITGRKVANNGDIAIASISSANDVFVGDSGANSITLENSTFNFDSAFNGVNFSQPAASARDGGDFNITAQASTNTGGSGGYVNISGGNKNGTGKEGGARLRLNGTTFLEVAELASGTQRVIALNRGANITTTQVPSGDAVTYVGNAATNPSSNPVGGGILYSDAGAGKWRGTSGTVTTFGPAEPHCPNCNRDFAIEWEHDGRGEHLAICFPCLLDELKNIGLDHSKFAIHHKLK